MASKSNLEEYIAVPGDDANLPALIAALNDLPMIQVTTDAAVRCLLEHSVGNCIPWLEVSRTVPGTHTRRKARGWTLC
jgi:hypothetical protein